MRLAFFTDTFFPQVNGVSRTMERQIQYLKSRGDEIIIFAPEYKNYDGEKFDGYGRMETFRSMKVFFYPECRLSVTYKSRIRQCIMDFRPDLIHIVTEFTIGIAGLLVGRELGIPMVSSFHTDYDKYMDYYKMSGLKPLAWKILKKIHNSCALTFCPSETTKKLLTSKGIKNVHVLSNGVETDFFSPDKKSHEIRRQLGNQDKIMILYVGRVALEKDIDVLIDAYRLIKEKYSSRVSLVITGDGPVRQKYQQACGDEIIFTGYMKGDDLARIYASADFFAYPSTTETFGNVVVEAMSSGLPVIAAASGGVLDTVKDGYNGILTEPRNPESFARGLEHFIVNEKFRQECGKNAREFALSKNWDLILQDMYNTFERIIEENPRPEFVRRRRLSINRG